MDCAVTRSTRSDRKRHRSRAEQSEAELGRLKKDYLCRTVVVERVDLVDGVHKDCEGVICDVHGPDDFEVVFFDGCTRRLTMEELEVVLVPEHDTDDEGAASDAPGGDGEDRGSDEEAGESAGDSDGAAPELSALELRRLANIARNQEILRALEVDADVETIAAAASRARAEGRPAKKKRRAAGDASFVPRRAPASAPGKAPSRARARAPPPRPRSASAAVPTGAAARRTGKWGIWTDVEERLLLDAMQAAGVVERGSSYCEFLPLAETAGHLFGGSRSTISIACKVQALLIKGPTANNIWGGSGTSRMLGVYRRDSKSASLPPFPALLAPPAPNKSNCTLEGPRPALPTSERDTTGRWRADISIDGKDICLGRYTDASEAGRARDRCVRRALPPKIQRLCRPRGGRPPQPFSRMRRASLAALGAPAFGSTFAQLFNDADAAAALVAADGELQPPPESSNANIKKLYRANAKAGVTRLHPGMLELWRLHTAAPAAAMPAALPVTAAPSADGAPPTAAAAAAAADDDDDDEEGPRALPLAKSAPPARGAWRAMLGLTLPGASR